MFRFLEAHIASLAIGSAVALGIYVFYGPSGGRQKRGELRGLVRILYPIKHELLTNEKYFRSIPATIAL